MTDTRIRLNVISEIAMEAGQARPIHMFRPGTFTDMNGRETSFTRDDVAGIVARFSKRRKLPITERHDFGQAIGRLQDVWADGEGNLFGSPKWNAKGKALLEDETYDGFSCELDRADDGWMLIGGSLTNYPAVGGLEPVMLAAPPLQEIPPVSLPSEAEVAPALSEETQTVADPPPFPAPSAHVPAPVDRAPIPTTQGVSPMADILEPVAFSDVAVPPLPTFPAADNAAMQARLDAYMAQIEQRNAAIQAGAFARAQAEFDRRVHEMEQRGQIEQFARAKTTTSTDQAYAMPCTADELTSLLLETPAAVRSRWQTLLNRITAAGLVTFDEIGSSGAGGEEVDRFNAIVEAKVKAGMKKTEAITQTAREHPSLYQAQSLPKGRR